MIKILYVHGYEGSANGDSSKLLKKCLNKVIPNKDFVLLAPEFYNDVNKVLLNVRKIKEYANKVDVIVASSFGAICTLLAGKINTPKILINPALLPRTELVNLGIVYNYTAEAYFLNEIESNISKYLIASNHNKNTWYIISKNDDVIGIDNVKLHIQLIKDADIDAKNLILINTTHHALYNQSALKTSNIIWSLYVNQLNESDNNYMFDSDALEYDDADVKQLFESTIYCTSTKQKAKYIDALIPLITDSYKNSGGFAGDIRTELMGNLVFFRIETNSKKEPLVVQAYKGNKSFRKAFLVGTDKSNPESKEKFSNLVSDNLKNIKKYGYYLEVSGAPEHIFIDKFNYPKVPNTQVVKYFKLMKPTIKLELNPDGYHYTRTINGERYEKIMVGIDPYIYLKTKKPKTY